MDDPLNDLFTLLPELLLLTTVLVVIITRPVPARARTSGC